MSEPIEHQISIDEDPCLDCQAKWAAFCTCGWKSRWHHADEHADNLTCRECGADMWISDDGTAHHWGNGVDDIDHDTDADHVPIPDPGDAAHDAAQAEGNNHLQGEAP